MYLLTHGGAQLRSSESEPVDPSGLVVSFGQVLAWWFALRLISPCLPCLSVTNSRYMRLHNLRYFDGKCLYEYTLCKHTKLTICKKVCECSVSFGFLGFI